MLFRPHKTFVMGIEDRIRSIVRQEVFTLRQFISEALAKQKDPEESRYLTRKQVAKYLSIGLSTVDYWAKTKKLIKVNVNGSIRFDKVEIDAHIQQGTLSKFKKS